MFQPNSSIIPAQAGFIHGDNHAAARGQDHRHKYLLMSKDVLPKNAISQGFWPDFAGATLFHFDTEQSEIYARISN